MKKLILFLLLAGSAWAQTTVTGTVVDPNGNPYANGTASAYSLTPSGQPFQTVSPVPTSSAGSFTLTAPTAATYIFTICAPPVLLGVPTVNPQPTQVCFSSPPIAISGPTQSVSSQLTSVASVLGPKGSTSSGGAGVVSFNGRQGIVVGTNGDYSFSQIGGTITPSQNPLGIYGNGSTTVGNLPLFVTNSTTLGNSLWTDNGTASIYAGQTVGVGSGDPSCGSAVGCAAFTEGTTEGTPTASHSYIRADPSLFGHAFVASVNGDGPLLMMRSRNQGAVGQVAISNADGTFSVGDPNISFARNTLFSAQSATGTATSPSIPNPLTSGYMQLAISGAGITGSPAGCQIQLFYVQAASGIVSINPFATVFFTPSNAFQSFSVAPTAAAGTMGDNVQGVFSCGTYPGAGTFTASFNPAVPIAPSGSAIPANITQIGGQSLSTNVTIAHDPSQTSTCSANSNAATNTLTISSLVINAADTVMVSISAGSGVGLTSVTDSGGSVYSQLATRLQSSARTIIAGTGASAALASTSVTVTLTGNTKFVACVSTYTGVQSFGSSSTNSGVNNNPFVIVNTQDPGNFVFAAFTQATTAFITANTGTLLAQAQTTATTPASGAICDNTASVPTAVQCGVNIASGNWSSAGVELRSEAATSASFPVNITNQPTVNAVNQYQNASSPAVAFGNAILCSNKVLLNAFSTNTITQEVAISGTTKIYLCGWTANSSSTVATTVKLVYGTGSNCATGTTDFSESFTLQALSANSPVGFVDMTPINTVDSTPAGQALCVNQSVAQPVNIKIYYAQF